MTPAREFKTPTICDSDGEIIWQAHPGFQTDLVNCPFPNVVLPGGRGSGKTDGCISKMLMHCLLYGEYANAKFFRVMKTDAEDLALRVDKVVGPLCGRNKSVRAMRWEISNGATMSISYLNERSLTSVQQGANTTMQCFDETTKYVDPRPIDMVLGSLRSTAPHVRTQRLLAANPWSEGHGWFYKRYVQRAGWYEPFQVPLDPEVQELLPDDFDEDGDLSIMLPSTVLDNPNTNNADFRRRLLRVGTVEQVLAWLTNDWSINFGAYFGRTFNESVHVVKADDMFAPSKGWRHIRVMDWGFHDPACVLYVAVDPRGNAFIYDELYFSRKGSRTRGAEMTAPEVAEAIVRHERESDHIPDEFRASIGDMPGNVGGSGNTIQEDHAREGIRWQRPKKTGRNYRAMTLEEVGSRLMKSCAPSPSHGLFIFERCEHTVDQVKNIPRKMTDVREVDQNYGDHALDCVRMACDYASANLKKIDDYHEARDGRRRHGYVNNNGDYVAPFAGSAGYNHTDWSPMHYH